jgi:hypothetical protein
MFMKKLKQIFVFAIFFLCSAIGNAQKQEADSLANTFWRLVKDDSSAFVISKQLAHADVDVLKLSETLNAIAMLSGKPKVIDRKGLLVAHSTEGLMGKGTYVCFNYRNQYEDALLGSSIVFEKLLFFKQSKKEDLKLVQYSWSKKATDISCD